MRNVTVADSFHVAFFRQEIEMEQCGAYVQMRQAHQLPPIPQTVDNSALYDLVDESGSIYERIPGQS